MKTGTTGSAIVKLNDGNRVQVRMRHRGYFPSSLNAALEESLAESIHTFLTDANYRLEQMNNRPSLFTDVMEMELEQCSHIFEDIVHYTMIKHNGGLSWNIEVHLEEASAPCLITLDIAVVDKDLDD